MSLSSLRAALLDARRPKPAAEARPLPDRPRGPRRSHIAATVKEARHLVETTLMTYAEIGRRTGVPGGTIWHWSKHQKWMRPTFAPRWTHTVPVWRAGRQRRRRMLGVRLVALAERYVRALEAALPRDVERLRLRARGVDIARAPSAALTDFIESCAAGYNPARDPMLRERGRYSKRKKERARRLRGES